MKRIYLKPVSKTLSLRLVASIAAKSGGNTVGKIDDPNGGDPYVIGDGNENPENPDGPGSRYLKNSMWDE